MCCMGEGLGIVWRRGRSRGLPGGGRGKEEGPENASAVFGGGGGMEVGEEVLVGWGVCGEDLDGLS